MILDWLFVTHEDIKYLCMIFTYNTYSVELKKKHTSFCLRVQLFAYFCLLGPSQTHS